MALNFGLLDQGGPTNFFEGYSQGQEKMQANAMAQQRAAQAQQEFGMRQQEFAAGQADKQRVAKAARVTQGLALYRDALLRSRDPTAARRVVQMQYADPDIGPIRSRLGTLEQALAEVPEETSAFQKYLEDEAMGIETVLKQQAGDREFNTAMGRAPARAAPPPAPTASAAAVAPTVQASIDDMVSRGIPRETITVEDGKIYVGSYGSNVVGEPPIMEKYFTPEGSLATRPQAPLTPLRVAANQMAPGSVNAMAPQAPAAAAPPSELQTLIDRRDNLSRISNQTAKVKTNIDNLNKDIARLSPAAAGPTNLAKLLSELAALPANDPRRADYLAMIKKETTPVAGTTVTMVAEKAEAGEFGKMLVNQFSDISKSANLAVKTLPSIEANLSSLNKGFDTGFGTDAKAAGAKVLGALGVQNAEQFATDAQTFQSNAINAVLQKQLEQKGPQTESDARRIEQVGAELGKTKQANEFILAIAKEQLKRDIEQRNFYAKWKDNTDSFKGAENAWFAGEGSKSLFDRPGLKKYSVSTPSAVNQIPSGAPAAPASNITQQRQDANAAIAKGAPAAAVRQRFKQNTGQEL
jgi:transcription initiation factor TFIIIB Brf1 subunit/transcription initiation factor TFIIB